jgi:hypothetical protein
MGPTVTLVSSEGGKLFGGYTSLSWSSQTTSEWMKDEKAFIFSLSNRTKHPQV